MPAGDPVELEHVVAEQVDARVVDAHRGGGLQAQAFLFGGQLGVMTDPAGLNYMRFRWYSPHARRFLSEDARLGDISMPGSLNRYSYGGNNPVSMVDPSGEFGFIGALVAVTAQLVVRQRVRAGVSLGESAMRSG